MTEQRLENCPFCGGEAELDRDTDDDLYIYENVSCSDEGCIGAQLFVSPKAWNTRASTTREAALQAEVERLGDKITELEQDTIDLEDQAINKENANNVKK